MKNFLALLLLATTAFAADLVPAAKLSPDRMRVVGGTYGLGVVGGIPARTSNVIDITASPYNYVQGVDNVATKVNAAMAALAGSGSEATILIPAGTHIGGGFLVPGAGGGNIPTCDFTIRGAGSELTIITNGSFSAGVEPYFNSVDTVFTNVVASGATKDSTSVVVASTTGLEVGKLIQFQFPNDYRIPVMSPANDAQYLRTQITRITAINTGTNTITFNPPLVTDFSDLETLTGLPIKIAQDGTARAVLSRVGLEGMTLDANGASGPIVNIKGSSECWVKDVKMLNIAGGHGWKMETGVRMEIRHCWLGPSGGTGSNNSGILFQYQTSALIEDNIFESNQPNIELWLTNTNIVFGYNFMAKGTNGLNFNVHNNHNSFILVEGNIIPNVQVDTYFGSASEIGIYRNWLFARHGTFASNTATFALDVERFVRNSFIVGNVLLAPEVDTSGWDHTAGAIYGLGAPYGGASNGTAQLSAGDPWFDWDATNNRTRSWAGTLTTRTSALTGVWTANTIGIADSLEASLAIGVDRGRASSFAGFQYFGTRTGNSFPIFGTSADLPTVSSTITLYPGVLGFHERDLDVAATMTLRGNYDYIGLAIPSDQSMGSDTFPSSLYRSVAPEWFGSLGFPVVNPATPPAAFNQAAFTKLPAAYRYYNSGAEPYLTGVATPEFSPLAGFYQTTQTVNFNCGTPSASLYYTYTTDGSTPADPTTSSTLYNAPLTVSVTYPGTRFKVLAVKSGLTDSAIATATFVEDTIAPTQVGNAVVISQGNQIQVTMSEGVAIGSGGSGGWAVDTAGSPVTLTYSSIVGSVIKLVPSRTIFLSDTISNLRYTSPTNGVEDNVGNDLATYSGGGITNNSVQLGTATGAWTDTFAAASINGSQQIFYYGYFHSTDGTFALPAGTLSKLRFQITARSSAASGKIALYTAANVLVVGASFTDPGDVGIYEINVAPVVITAGNYKLVIAGNVGSTDYYFATRTGQASGISYSAPVDYSAMPINPLTGFDFNNTWQIWGGAYITPPEPDGGTTTATATNTTVTGRLTLP